MKARIGTRRLPWFLALLIGACSLVASPAPAGAGASGTYYTLYGSPAYWSTDTVYKTYDPYYWDFQGALSDYNNPWVCDYMAGWYYAGGWNMGAAGYFWQCENPYNSNWATYVTSIYSGTPLLAQGYYNAWDRVVVIY